ncbi:DUF3180 domain-containing protein [Brachybacterium huguangmaarense]|uniref:DUF3180 domain-containing protein n=1 Tax=Brachybacterium huguangmaarense TaxID=1652028 RepID=A0ABY6G0Q6_9MICO|nr:DUF3180 domain-containing protein [Brachybacterium huguangmaarense]UYG16665.1 DUF3180 domain-containing protein [Brachybacterium huguangmaarense]
MKPLNIPWLIVALLAAAAVGALASQLVASHGSAIPVAGWLTGIVLLVLAGVLLLLGLPLRRYLQESEERHRNPTLAPRRHQLDMPTAYRTVLLARAAALTGAIVGGLFAGEALFLLGRGGGDLVQAVLPTSFAALGGIVLGIVGVIVERWGTLPPEDGGNATESTGTRA